MILRLFALGFALVAWLSPAKAVVLHAEDRHVSLAQTVAYLKEVPGQPLSLAEVASNEFRNQFTHWPRDAGHLALGFQEAPVWIRVELQRTADTPAQWLLQVADAYINTLDFYAEGQPVVQTGNRHPLASRPIFHRFFVFPIEVTELEKTFYLRAESDFALTVPLSVWTPQAFSEQTQATLLSQSVYYGGLLILAVYNLFLFFSLQDRRFLWYSLYALSLNFGVFSANGFGRLFFWPDVPVLEDIAAMTAFSLTGFFALSFSQGFLNSKELAPRIHRVMDMLRLIYLGNAVLLLSAPFTKIPYAWLYQVVAIAAALTVFCVAWAGYTALKARVPAIRFFLIGWGFLWVGVIVSILRAYGLIPTTVLTYYAVQISSGLEMLFLALALFDLINQERQSRIQAQAREIDAKRMLVDTLKNEEQRLEKVVQERTAELEARVTSEKQTLRQYVRFGALISHEFRNPLSIIDNQVALIRRVSTPSQETLNRLEAIQTATQRLATLFNQWIESDRLRHALDQQVHLEETNLATWIPALLTQQPNYQREHTLECRTTSSRILCLIDTALFETAVRNLLDNACKYSPPRSQILITVSLNDDYALVTVSDQGEGIPAEERDRVFDDYYRRTSDVSKESGVGLGLAFVKRIMDLHHGFVRILDEPAPGAVFQLGLPLHPTITQEAQQ
ncbi:MAG: sensor histidine kinase [Burkholderiaceae bacterium]